MGGVADELTKTVNVAEVPIAEEPLPSPSTAHDNAALGEVVQRDLADAEKTLHRRRGDLAVHPTNITQSLSPDEIPR